MSPWWQGFCYGASVVFVVAFVVVHVFIRQQIKAWRDLRAEIDRLDASFTQMQQELADELREAAQQAAKHEDGDVVFLNRGEYHLRRADGSITRLVGA